MASGLRSTATLAAAAGSNEDKPVGEGLLRLGLSCGGTTDVLSPLATTDPAVGPQRQDRSAPSLLRCRQGDLSCRAAGLVDLKIVLQAGEAAINGAIDLATVFQAATRSCGTPIEVKKQAVDGSFDKVWLNGSSVASCWGGRPAATQMLAIAYKTGAPWNETHWTNAMFDNLLAAAQDETDPTRRKSLLWDFQVMLHDDCGSLTSCFRDWLDVHSIKVGGHIPHGGLGMNNGRMPRQPSEGLKGWKPSGQQKPRQYIRGGASLRPGRDDQAVQGSRAP